MVGQRPAAGNGSGELGGLTRGLLVPKGRYLEHADTQRTGMSLVGKSLPCPGWHPEPFWEGSWGPEPPSPGVSPEGRWPQVPWDGILEGSSGRLI